MALVNCIVRLNKVTDIKNIGKEISKQLQQYTKEVAEEVDKAKDEVSKNLQKELKQKSPKKTGDYKKGWRVKKVKKANIVYNKTDYQLTHLLEYGHVKRGGGRVQPQVHIRPTEERAINDYLDRIEKAVKK
jgi:hypothetical protein